MDNIINSVYNADVIIDKITKLEYNNMTKVFKTSDGNFIPHPDSRHESLRIRHRLYIDYCKCGICGSSSTRFAKSDNCIMCQRYKIELVRHFSTTKSDQWPSNVPTTLNNPYIMKEVNSVLKMMLETPNAVLHYEPCREYGHVRISNGNDQCMQCTNRLKPREQAIVDSEPTYVSTSPCTQCNNITLRKTDNKECLVCEHVPSVPGNKAPTSATKLTPDTIMMRDAPDTIVSREDAEIYGFKVYRTGQPCRRGHTGWRYVSTGNCIDCLKGDK